MALSKVFNGSRARVSIYDPNTNTTQIVGSFTNISYSWNYEIGEAPILGRTTVAETSFLGASTVQVTATGWRCLGFGAHTLGMPKLQDILTSDYFELEVADRASEAAGAAEARVVRITQCRLHSYSTGVAGRAQSEVTYGITGIIVSDESVTNAEGAGAADLPG